MSDEPKQASSEKPVIFVFITILNGGALVQSYLSGGLWLTITSISISLAVVATYYRKSLSSTLKAFIRQKRKTFWTLVGVATLLFISVASVALIRTNNERLYNQMVNRANLVDTELTLFCDRELRFDNEDAILVNEYPGCDIHKVQDSAAFLIRACAVDKECGWRQVDEIRRALSSIPEGVHETTKEKFFSACKGGMDSQDYKELMNLSTKAFSFKPFGISYAKIPTRFDRDWPTPVEVRDEYYFATRCDDPRTVENFRNQSCRSLTVEEQQRACSAGWNRASRSFRRLDVLKEALRWHDEHKRAPTTIERAIYGNTPPVPSGVFTGE